MTTTTEATETTLNDRRRSGWRARWAAVGAAVAVSLGAGGVLVSNAAIPPPSPPSSFVAVTATRVLDTRTNLGLVGSFTSPVARDLQITGAIATATGTQTVVPLDSAGWRVTAVILNVTVVGPTAAGFVSVRPSDAAGLPTTSSLNFVAGQIIANSATVQLGMVGADAGKIEIIYDAFGASGPTTQVLVDVVGYVWELTVT